MPSVADRKDRHRHGRHPQQAYRPSPTEGSHPARGFDCQAGDPRPRHTARARDRAMLLLGFAGGLRRSEIVAGRGRDQTEDGRGWIEVLDKGMLVTLRGKTGWR
jgi:integrase